LYLYFYAFPTRRSSDLWCLPVLVAKYFGLASLVLPIPAPRAVGGQRLHDCCLVWFTISARHEKLEKTIKFFWLPPGPDAGECAGVTSAGRGNACRKTSRHVEKEWSQPRG